MEKIEVSADISANLTSLIEKLAQQIGTSADTIFPWYVQQQVIEGWTALAVMGVFTLIGLIMFLVGWKKVDFEGEFDPYAALFIGGGMVLFFTLLIGGIEMSDVITKIVNPHYHAMKKLTMDLAQLAK